MASLKIALGGLKGAVLSPSLQAAKLKAFRGHQMIVQASMSTSSLSKADLVDIIKGKTEGLKKDDIKSVIDALTDTIVNAVAKDQKVILTGFGSFERATRAARKGRNPKTGEEMDLPEKVVPTFKAGKVFKDTVANSK